MEASRLSSQNRFQIMSYEQVLRLTRLLNDRLVLCCEVGCQEPLELSLSEIIGGVKGMLDIEHIRINNVRLIGGAAAYVISCPDSFSFKDIDIVFTLDTCQDLNTMDRIRTSVLTATKHFLERCKISSRKCYPERYISKQICVRNSTTEDYWSLFCLGCSVDANSDVVELKFANSIEREYESSVDSFQIVLDPALRFIEQNISWTPTKYLYPTVVSESVWGSFKDALHHLRNKYIVIKSPEQIRGGGLLKYCKLLAEGFKAHPDLDTKYAEKYMCSRFFIDFPLLSNQRDKILTYLNNHFPSDFNTNILFLRHLSKIVQNSSVNIGIDRLRSVFLIDSIVQELWIECTPMISFSDFNDPNKWSVSEIILRSCAPNLDAISSSSSISTPISMSSDQSSDIDS